jgi:hypothetical protein
MSAVTPKATGIATCRAVANANTNQSALQQNAPIQAASAQRIAANIAKLPDFLKPK